MGDKSAYEDAREFKDHWVQQLIDKLTNIGLTQKLSQPLILLCPLRSLRSVRFVF
jgi:hypothetical protein